MFDCWMEQQEENNQPKHIAVCCSGFMNSLAQLKAPTAKPMPKLTGPYIVYFGLLL
jgi:OOP family OmpA-OmpF porin